ncbi:interleukin-1 receptor type 1-like isoform X2 [Echeneis naucrates]|uniref:interleukin-1 receptor type 1-like isoform X2 n=1 Tax=Echeneis naucrates TaxID=173247 RepID=UPI0011145AA2|nr:interleukin-1 receptor type 1-like isoform X2 [Echeneis naucrates]
MNASGFFCLVLVLVCTSECSETAEPECDVVDVFKHSFLAGEAFLVPYSVFPDDLDKNFIWYKNNSKVAYISSDKNASVHYDGGELIFLNLLLEDSGIYTARLLNSSSGVCQEFKTEIKVFNASERNNSDLFYGKISAADQYLKVSCPHPLTITCERFGGNFSWYKDFSPLPANNHVTFLVENASKKDNGVYTCVCTWMYNHKVYNSSASRKLEVVERQKDACDILSPSEPEQLAAEGSMIKLNCSVFCGTNADECEAKWYFQDEKDRYSQTTDLFTDSRTKNVISTATLTIDKVSAEDFSHPFTSSVKAMVIRTVCVLLFFVLAVVLIKFFIIDIVLFFRAYLPVHLNYKDPRLYDAYVVYQTQNMDKETEIMLSHFVTEALPSVLEKKCGYRLFIHGRDDIPGEDRLEMVEYTIKESKILMVILTPGSGSKSETADRCPTSTDSDSSVVGGFDWQVGLHQVLVQRDMKVILIQVGDTGPQGYTHLPPGLQHLIRKNAPLKWPNNSRGTAAWNSRFWKRVRYLMPATPAKKCPRSAVI